MRVLVTGGAGFIGSNLVRQLKLDGHQVVAQDDFSSAHWTNLKDFRGDLITCDLADDLHTTFQAHGPFEVIFHEASITDTTVHDQRQMLQNNMEGFRNLLELAVSWGSRVIWASSCSIYGQGPVPMKESQPHGSTECLRVFEDDDGASGRAVSTEAQAPDRRPALFQCVWPGRIT